jgi:predicted nucleic acid-binding protein
VVAAAVSRGLIDTDILVDDRRGLPDGKNFIATQHAACGIAISIVSAMELVSGCRDARAIRHLQTFLAAIAVVPLTGPVSIRALQWMEQFSVSHGLTIPDALIAATASEQGLTLYTKNLRHFHMLPGLQVIRPY